MKKSKLVKMIFGEGVGRVRRYPQIDLSNVEIESLDLDMFRSAFDFNRMLLAFISSSDTLSPQMNATEDADPDYYINLQGNVFNLISDWKNRGLSLYEIAYQLEILFENVDISLNRNKYFRDSLVSMLELLDSKTSLSDWCDSSVSDGVLERFRPSPDIFLSISKMVAPKIILKNRIEVMENNIRSSLKDIVREDLIRDGFPEVLVEKKYLEIDMQKIESEADKPINVYLECLSRLRPVNFTEVLMDSANLFDIYFDTFFDDLRSAESDEFDKMVSFYNLIKVSRVIFENEYLNRFDDYLTSDNFFIDRGVLIYFYSSMALYYCLLETIYSILVDMQKRP